MNGKTFGEQIIDEIIRDQRRARINSIVHGVIRLAIVGAFAIWLWRHW